MPDITGLQFYDREDRPWPGLRLTSSAIVGHTTDTTSRIWVRVHREGRFCLLYATERIDKTAQPRVVRGRGRTETVELEMDGARTRWDGAFRIADITFATDATHVFDLRDLEPDTRYHYALFAADGKQTEAWEVGRDEELSFVTANATASSLSFGLFSCHMPFSGREIKNMHMWDALYETLQLTSARFVIGCGDQVYTDGDARVNIWRWLKSVKKKMIPLSQAERRKVMTSWYRDIYRGYWGNVALRNVFRSFPTYMIWDDHEIMDGWGSYTKSELSNQLDTIWEWENKEQNLALTSDMFEVAKVVYHEYQHSHNPPTARNQWDYAFEQGRLAFYVLDMRGHRDFERSRNAILGRAQMTRLKKWLEGPAESAAVALIVSPVPVVHLREFIVNHLDLPLLGIADDLRDEWEHKSNWKERDEMLDAVFEFSQRTGKRVLFLSGDVHIGAAFKLMRKGMPDARVYQLTSSSITYAKAPGKLLKLAVRAHGELGGRKDVTFSQLHIFEENNYAIVTTGTGDSGEGVTWTLFGNTGREGEIIQLKKLWL